MLTFDDCLALCELSEEEILALREHEHLPDIVALEMADYIMHGPDGTTRISQMIEDDIREAQRRGNVVHAAQLKLTLRRFIETHPSGRR
jgi:hypothetical protein